MKALSKRFIEATATVPIFRSTYEACGVIGRLLLQVRGHARFMTEAKNLDEETLELACQLFPDRTVMDGPFRGMQYPSFQSAGSALLPKLLGSYESELHHVICDLSHKDFGTIVDIGCAEGYYAIGAALLWKDATIYAYEMDPSARNACARMAELNGVSARVHMMGKCEQSALLALPLESPSLIIADCEGYEKHLFTESSVARLSKHDFIIELHDFIDIEISPELKKVFSKTHDVSSILSVDDLQKVHQYKSPLLDTLSKKQARVVLNERRPCVMEWLVARSRVWAH